MSKVKFLSTLFALLMMVSFANAQKGNSNAEIIKTLYEKGFSATPESNATLQKYLADKFTSSSSSPGKGKQELIGMMQYVYQLVPNMKWEVKQIVKQGNQFVVRCEVTGNPKGDFMGVKTDGSKSFNIMCVHILTLEKGMVTNNFYVEDWASAIQQLSN